MSNKAPSYSIEINGNELDNISKANITEISVRLDIEDTSKLSFGISQYEGFGIKRDQLKLRSPVLVSFGYGDELIPIFDGEITQVSPTYSQEESSKLEITALDRSYLLKKKPFPFMFTGDKFDSLKAIAEHLVNKHKLSFTVDPGDKLEGYKLKDDQAIEQENETDWEILGEIADTGNYRLLCIGQTVYMVSREYLVRNQGNRFIFEHRPSSVDVNIGAVVPLMEFTPKLGASGQREKAMIISWTPEGKTTQTEEESIDADTEGNVGYTDIKIQSSSIEVIRVKGNVRTKGQAKALVDAELARRAENLVNGSGIVQGDPRIKLGSLHLFKLNDLDDIGLQYSGDYYITEVIHTMDLESGFRTQFSVQRNGLSK